MKSLRQWIPGGLEWLLQQLQGLAVGLLLIPLTWRKGRKRRTLWWGRHWRETSWYCCSCWATGKLLTVKLFLLGCYCCCCCCPAVYSWGVWFALVIVVLADYFWCCWDYYWCCCRWCCCEAVYWCCFGCFSVVLAVLVIFCCCCSYCRCCDVGFAAVVLQFLSLSFLLK